MDDRRFGFLDLLAQISQLVVVVILVFAPLAAAPYITSRLDRAGLPGALFAGLFIGLGPTLAILSLRKERASRRRSRAMRRAALDLGLHFAPGFRLPRSMRDLPSLAGVEILGSPRGWTIQRGYADLISGSVDGTEILVFDYWVKSDGAYAQTRWHTLAAARIGDEGRALLVEPRDIGSWVPATGLHEVTTESAAFSKRYRVRTKDPKFTSAFLDGRMIEFLLELSDPWTFEVGDSWLAVTAHQIPTQRISQLIETLQAFRRHVPRVIASMYPEPGPTFV